MAVAVRVPETVGEADAVGVHVGVGEADGEIVAEELSVDVRLAVGLLSGLSGTTRVDGEGGVSKSCLHTQPLALASFVFLWIRTKNFPQDFSEKKTTPGRFLHNF